MQKIASSNLLIHPRWAISALRLTDGDVLLIYTLALFAVGGFGRLLGAGGFNAYSLFEINAGELLAIIAIYSVVKSQVDTVLLGRIDLAILSISAMFFLLPDRPSPFVGATISGFYFWRRTPSNEQLKLVGQLLLAVSCYEIWGRVFFRLVSAPIVTAEAFVIAKVGQFLGLGLGLDGIRITSPSGWYVYIMEACSSFHNISLAVLVWLSLIRLSGAKLSRSKLLALGVGILAIICLNVFRILLMTSKEAYSFWHIGNGATIFSCLTLLAIAIPTTISLRLQDQ